MEAAEVNMKEVTQAAWNKRPLIISGPCSAETETQVLETAVPFPSIAPPSGFRSINVGTQYAHHIIAIQEVVIFSEKSA